MTTQYTTLLGLALPVTGELQGTWGDTVNNSITQLCEDAIAGVATASVTASDWTLTTTGAGASNQARMAILIPTGSPGVSRNIIAPSKSKTYTVINQSNANVVIKGSATTGVTIAAGDTVVVAWNGSDFVALKSTAASTFASITDSSLTSGRVTYAGTGGLLQDSAAFTFDGTTLTSTKFAGALNGTVGATTPSTGAFTTLSASSTVSGTGFSNYLASPPAIGGTVAAAGAFTTLSASSTVSGTGFSNYLASPPAIGGTAAAAGAFTTLSASSTVSGTGFSNYLASPPAIGGTAAAAGAFTTLSASSTVSGTGFSNYLASPPAIGGTVAAAGAFTFVGAGTATSANAFVNIAAGTATIAPAHLASGVLRSSVVQGDYGFDGANLYFVNDTVSGLGYVPVTQRYGITSNLSNVGPTTADFFPANSTITLAANSVYEIEYYLRYVKATSNGTIGLTLLSNNNWNNLCYFSTLIYSGSSAVLGAANKVVAASSFTFDPYAITFTSNVACEETLKLVITTGTSNQTLRIQVGCSAGAVTPQAGSYYKVTRIPTSNTGTFVA